MINTENYKTKLENLLTSLTDELKSLGVHNPEVASDWITTPATASETEPDSNIEADRTEDWDERRATLSLLETRYNNLKRALKKIEDGTYGICEISGEEIEEDRLAANPAARTSKKHLDEEGNLPS